MSFLSQQKDEIISEQYKNSCCRRALICGILFTKGEICDGKINIRLENERIAEYVKELLTPFSSSEPEIISPKKGGRYKLLSFSSRTFDSYMRSLSDESEPVYIPKCNNCKTAFMRGVFLASGRASDPKKQYRLEFSPTYRVERLKALLEDFGILLSKADQKGKTVLYTGKSSIIEDLFAELGLNTTAFELMNIKIEGEFKNTANRIRNCETNNIGKSITASMRQSEAIEALANANLLSMLPDDLEKTARMRLQYRDYSLSRLAAEFSPPISKPGLSHRLNKIVEIADTLIKKDIK